MNILIAEDDVEVSSILTQALTEEGYVTEVVSDGQYAYEMANAGQYSLLLVDLMLLGLDGFTLCKRLREDGIATPILIITALDGLKDKVQGLDNGADDYIVKPFLLEELLARVRALMRRSALPLMDLRAADLSLNPRTRKLVRDGQSISLSSTECLLLEFLMRNQGRVLSRSEIFENVWEDAFNGNEKILDVYINHLRSKIDTGRSESLIQTLRGKGYCMARRDVV